MVDDGEGNDCTKAAIVQCYRKLQDFRGCRRRLETNEGVDLRVQPLVDDGRAACLDYT